DQAGALHVGAVGLVLLAYAPLEVQEAALVDVPGAAAIRDSLAAIEEDGGAQDEGPSAMGVRTLAGPVLRADGIAAGIGVAAPIDRAGRRWQARTRGALRRAAT